MISSDIINNRQNEDQYLKMQYAARKCYNVAEKINYLSWGFCILAALMIFVPDSTTNFITLGIPVLLEIAAFATAIIFNNKVKNAADLRNHFDSHVLMINEGEYTDSEKSTLRELALNIYQNNLAEAEISIRNTGRDNPPGVRNWYEFKRNVQGINSQYECQKQNIWWNKKMIKNRLVWFPVIFVILLAAFVLMFVLFESDILSIIACSIGIIIKTAERIIEHYNYHVISIQIETIKNHIENKLTTENINDLQSLINKRRSIPVLEINRIHKTKAKKFSESYEIIS